MSDPARDLLLSAAGLLEQGRTIDRLSRPLTAAALIILAINPPFATWWGPAAVGVFLVVALAGLVEAYLAIRVNFDAALFRQAATGEAPDFSGIDDALIRLGLLPAVKKGRPIDARIAGARRLFRYQVRALLVQALAMVIAPLLAFALVR